jgi:hypothetical protein
VSIGIADLYVVPSRKPNNIPAELTGFMLVELLAQRKAVFVVVDETDASSLDFYRGLGFEDLGAYYKADLK